MAELLSLIAGVAIGALGGGALSYAIVRPSKLAQAKEKQQTQERQPAEAMLVSKPQLEKTRRELKTSMLEKELLSGAITRLFEAESEGKISKEERERLVLKYRDQLRGLEQKLSDVELYIEVGELENLRDELVNLFESKVTQIESRLQDARIRLEKVHGPLAAVVPEQAEKSVEGKAEKSKPKVESEADRKVREIRDEVLEALARLEQIDLE